MGAVNLREQQRLETRDKILYKIKRLSPFWTEPPKGK